jgi:hypothetical protein
MAKAGKDGTVRRRGRGRRREPTAASKLARSRALEVLSLMRTKRQSLAEAAREAQTTRKTVVRYVGVALLKTGSRRYAAKPFDRLARSLRFLTPEGQIAVTVRSSRTASKIAEYWAAVDHYLRTGDTERLHQFSGKSVRAGKEQFPFITDPRTLNRIASAGEVAFEDIYASTA